MLPHLPNELWMMIYKHLHKSYMCDLRKEIEHNVVWIRTNNSKKNKYEYSFLIGKKNYYATLLEKV